MSVAEKIYPAPPPEIPSHVCGWLDVDLQKLAMNYNTLKQHASGAECTAVLKANAYGLGLIPIAECLVQEGCRTFFVAHVEEGLVLRQALPSTTIYVLTGCLPETEGEMQAARLTPVLNDMQQFIRWAALGKRLGKKLPALIHIDTGMLRNGFDTAGLKDLKNTQDLLSTLNLKGIMSHLACSPDARHPQNEEQRRLFEIHCQSFPDMPASLADTAGIYLGNEYHYNFVRPGKGLFGLFQAPKGPDLEQVFTLNARIIQTRSAEKGESVGYGALAKLSCKSRLATLGIGYADGLDRRCVNQGYALIDNFKAPIMGSLSMDYTVIDITDIPEDLCPVGGWVQLSAPHHPLEEMATHLGTISRELSTRLGPRLFRTHRP